MVGLSLSLSLLSDVRERSGWTLNSFEVGGCILHGFLCMTEVLMYHLIAGSDYLLINS